MAESQAPALVDSRTGDALAPTRSRGRGNRLRGRRRFDTLSASD